MGFSSVEEAVAALRKLEANTSAYNHALGVLSLDAVTAAPKGSSEGRSVTMGILSEIVYRLESDPAHAEMYAYLDAHAEELDPQVRREAEVGKKRYEQFHRIPMDEYVAYNVLINDAQSIWEKAKNENDFDSFAPYLEKIVAFNRKFAHYYHPDMEPYDSLLNEYEEGLNMKTLDAFFEKLRETIVPLLAEIRQAEPINDTFLSAPCPVETQRVFSDYLMDVMGLDRKYCGIAETEHPFTTNFNNRDVRITTHYHENAVTSSMYSVIHEGGHAIYELGCAAPYNNTFLAGGVSMGIHESQSRFFENIIGRSEAFVSCIFPKIRELFPDVFSNVTAHEFFRAVNKAQPSLIRTEADELTYSLHIMVRYEIEKQLIDGTLAVRDVPARWNELYIKYLGIPVPDHRQGCLQDSHWSGGSIGYFPSYALGSAYGPQILAAMEKDLGDIWPDIARGNLCRVKEWLGEHIHQYACFYKPGELFERVCGKFDPAYYTEYLTKKYRALYRLTDKINAD